MDPIRMAENSPPPPPTGGGGGACSWNATRSRALQGSGLPEAAATLCAASNVVLIPGYGTGLTQAQFSAVYPAGLFAQQGKRVRFAIHPVGRGAYPVTLSAAG